jgi:hypothetical protein
MPDFLDPRNNPAWLPNMIRARTVPAPAGSRFGEGTACILGLRTNMPDGRGTHEKARHFVWPADVGSYVEAPDFKPTDECGYGLHFLAWGMGVGSLLRHEYDSQWVVVRARADQVISVEHGSKCKAPAVEIVYVGSKEAALALLKDARIAVVLGNSDGTTGPGAASATGVSGAASATGYSGAASATGARGAASATGVSGAASATGDSGAASATGVSGAASATGVRGAASATGDSGAASATGEFGVAYGESVAAGEGGYVVARWWVEDSGRYVPRFIGADVGAKRRLKPHRWYRYDGKKWIDEGPVEAKLLPQPAAPSPSKE